jgi:hypothetical protein
MPMARTAHIAPSSQILPSLDLPPSQTTARPSAELTLYQTAGRDVGVRLRQAYAATGFAESGFALPPHHFRAPILKIPILLLVFR